jgi:hypothetical protein
VDIKALLETEVARWRSIDAPPGGWLVQEFVLRQGRDFQGNPLPRGYRPMTPQRCFDNAAALAFDRRRKRPLTYMEGFIAFPGMPITIHHAWVLDEASGLLVDPTLSDPENYGYMGVAITREEYQLWKPPATSAVLSSSMRINVEFLTRRDPDLAVFVPSSDEETERRERRPHFS